MDRAWRMLWLNLQYFKYNRCYIDFYNPAPPLPWCAIRCVSRLSFWTEEQVKSHRSGWRNPCALLKSLHHPWPHLRAVLTEGSVYLVNPKVRKGFCVSSGLTSVITFGNTHSLGADFTPFRGETTPRSPEHYSVHVVAFCSLGGKD